MSVVSRIIRSVYLNAVCRLDTSGDFDFVLVEINSPTNAYCPIDWSHLPTWNKNLEWNVIIITENSSVVLYTYSHAAPALLQSIVHSLARSISSALEIVDQKCLIPFKTSYIYYFVEEDA